MQAMRALCVAATLVAGWLSSSAADFEVINTQSTGYGTFHQAILDANDNPGADRIVFNIPGSGLRTIQFGVAIPPVTEALEIDGLTQPGARANTVSNGFNGELLIRLDGGNRALAGLALQSGFCSVRGLVITRFNVGIRLASASNSVTGNFIGLDPAGTPSLGNGSGILTGGDVGNVIGGLRPQDRNVIGGNVGIGIQAGQAPAGSSVSTNLTVVGNYLGTDATGLAVASPGQSGTTVLVLSAKDFVLGGTGLGAGNVMAPGIVGVNVSSGANRPQIVGNSIGVGVDGRTPLRNTNTTSAFYLQSGAQIERNTIAYCGVAVRVFGTGATISANQIYSNDVAGILLGDALPANDVGDADSGPNERQNYPVVTAGFEGSLIHLTGILESKPDTTYAVEFFAARARGSNATVQGEYPLGAIQLTTAGNGSGAFDVTYPYPGGDLSWMTATATDPAGNTSIFSPGVPVRSLTRLFIHQHPVNVAITNGSPATFRAEFSGSEPIAYQWLWNGAELPGATNSTLSFTNATPAQRGFYRCLARNAFGSLETEAAELVVWLAPIFLVHPVSRMVVSGEWVTVSATVSDWTTTPIGFRWRSNNFFVSTTSGTQLHSLFSYRAGTSSVNLSVVVTNPIQRLGVVSTTATISVVADRDHDGLPDSYETAAGLDPDNPADALTDADADGANNLGEYTAGTDPRNPLNRLQIDRIAIQSGGAFLEFRATSNQTYRIEYADRVNGSPTPGVWAPLAAIPAARTNGPVTVRDPSASAARDRFYRVATPSVPP